MAVCNEKTKSFLETILNSYDDISNDAKKEIEDMVRDIRVNSKYFDKTMDEIKKTREEIPCEELSDKLAKDDMDIEYQDVEIMNNKIFDCPFCGKDSVSLTIGIGIVYVTCNSCLAAGPQSSIGITFDDELYSSAKQEAVERWNSVSMLVNKNKSLTK